MFNVVIVVVSSIVYSVNVDTKVNFSMVSILNYIKIIHIVQIGFLVILYCD